MIPEYKHENQGSHLEEGEIHHAEAVEEKVSLSDRFGLWVSFYPMSQTVYLEVVEHWVERLANEAHEKVLWSEALRSDALRWALSRGNRSGRTAFQFAKQAVGLKMLINK